MENAEMKESPAKSRPTWVRLAVGRVSTRKATLTQLAIVGSNLAIFLCITAVAWGSESLLGKIAFALGLAGTALVLIRILWVWLAIRWVDRNGQWA